MKRLCNSCIVMEIASMEVAGAQMVLILLAEYFLQCGYSVYVIVLNINPHNQFSERLEMDGIPTVYVEKGRNKIDSIFKKYRMMSKTIKELDPLIIHGHLDYRYLWLFSILHKKTFVETFHSQSYRFNTIVFRIMQRNLVKRGLIYQVFLSKKNEEEYKKLYTVDNLKSAIIANPIKKCSLEKKDTTITKKDIVFCFGARFNKIKNHRMLVEAFRKLLCKCSNVKLILAGEGDTKAEIEKLVESLGISDRVEFLGEINNMDSLLVNCDVGVISSDSECFPMFLLECMNAGLPIVATNVGGIPDIIDGNGILVERGDMIGLSNAMLKLVNSDKARAEMGNRSLELIQKYDIDIVGKKYLKLYNSIVMNNER